MKDKHFLKTITIIIYLVIYIINNSYAGSSKEPSPSFAVDVGNVVFKPSGLVPFDGANIDEQVLDLKISYNQSLSLDFDYKELSQTNWAIYHSNNKKLYAKGKGDKLFNVVFSKPGDYKIIFSNPSHKHIQGQCNHPTIPNEINLKVNSNQIIYKPETVTFSNPTLGGIDNIGGIDNKGNTLTIDVEVFSYSNVAVSIPNSINSTGINANMTGRLIEKQKLLLPGKHKITYILEGTLKKDTYIGFDFKDSNGKITCYYHKQKI